MNGNGIPYGKGIPIPIPIPYGNGVPFMETREEEATTGAHEDVPEDIRMPREILTYDMDGKLRKFVATIENPLPRSNEHCEHH